MTIFNFPEYEYMARKLRKSLKCGKGDFAVERYANQEMHVALKTNVRGKKCVILGTIIPPDSNLVSFLLLADTLKKEGAAKVIAAVPYFAYARHDKLVSKESLATAWVGRMLKNSGVDEIITFDLHSEEDKKLIPIPIKSLSAAGLFSCFIIGTSLVNASLAAPDNGAVKWCKAVKKASGMKTAIVYFKKRRIKTKIVLSQPLGKITPEVIIVDDMIDTGQTLLLACAKLRKMGVKKITIMVTHGIFTEKLWQKLWKLGVERIYCTDTLSLKHIPKDKRITIIPIVSVLQASLQNRI